MRPGVFPVFLKLGGKRVVVIGGGLMALEKVPALVEAGAEITLISPRAQPELRKLPIRIEERVYRPGDLAGAWYAVAAAPPEVNRAVSIEAGKRQIFLNAVDDLRHADVYLGSVLRR
ncbi:MAG: NAD(P)-dependent oxidoreductase, partial [Myxococcota bacterium]